MRYGSIRRIRLAGIVLALMACDEGGEPPLVAEEVLQLHEASNQVIFGLEHFVASEGIRRAHLLADTAFFLADEAGVELRVMEVTFYGSSGSVTSILTSRSGTYDWETGDMTATDSVVVINPVEERRIETSVMHYDRVRDRIWSDAPTKMFEADGTIIEGTAFDSDAALTEVNLTSARIQKPEPEPESEV